MRKSLIGKILARYGDTLTTPVPYVSAGPSHYVFSGSPGGTDNETYMRTFGTAGTIFSIVSLLAQSVASADWSLYRKPTRDGRVRYTTGDRGSDQRSEVVKHAALDLWNRPNSFYTRHELVETWQQHLELTGEAYGVISRDKRSSIPISLWPVRPDRMEPVPDPEKFIAGWVYTGPSGEKVPLQVDEVIQIKLPNPLSPYRGIGPVQSVLVDIDAMKYGSEWNRNFFINSATTGGIISFPNELTDEEFNEFSNRWRESHQGVARAHRVAILESGATWSPAQYSMRDMEFSTLRDVSRDVLREAWGIHKSMLGNADDVNRANAQTAEEVFGRWKVIPRLERIKMTLNERLLPLYGTAGSGVEFDYLNPLPDDREADNAELTAKANAAQVLISAGFNPDDVCEVVGLPPMGVAAPTPNPTGKLEQASESVGEPAEDENPFQNGSRPIVNLIRPLAAMPDHDLTAADGHWKAATEKLAAEYHRKIAPVQRQELLNQIRKVVDAGDYAALAEISASSATAAALILAAMQDLATTSADQAATEAQQQGAAVRPTTPPKKTLSDIAAITAALAATGLALSAGREAARIVTPGASGSDIADKVETFLETLSIAGITQSLQNAMSRAQNGSRIATFLTGPGADIYASEILDLNTCKPCEGINGTLIGNTDDPDIAAKIEALYPGGGYIGCQGGPRCRGTVIADFSPTQTPQDQTNHFTKILRDYWFENTKDRVNGHAKASAL